MTICTLKQLWSALENATDDEVLVMRDGIKMVSESAMSTPLMDLEYALSDQALAVVRRYAEIA